MTNMFGLPNIPIGDEANANHVRSRYSRNVIISYPTEEDWRRLYDNLVVHETGLYTSMRQSHQRSVSTQLQIINATSSGRAVFSELSGAPHEVMIFPYDFQIHHRGDQTPLTSRRWGSPHRMTRCMFADGAWPFAERTRQIKPSVPSLKVEARARTYSSRQVESPGAATKVQMKSCFTSLSTPRAICAASS